MKPVSFQIQSDMTRAENFLATLEKHIDALDKEELDQFLLIHYYQVKYECSSQESYLENIQELIPGAINQFLAQNENSTSSNFKIIGSFFRNGYDSRLSESSKELIETFDTELYRKGHLLLQKNDLTSLYYAVEILYYFSCRRKNQRANDYYQELMPLIHQKLEVNSNDTGAFLKKFVKTKNMEMAQLGLSNGISGIYLMLTQCYFDNNQETEIKDIIKAYIIYLISLKEEIYFSQNIYSAFPKSVGFENGQIEYSKCLNWHDGDLGQSIFIYKSYDLFKDPELKKIGDLIGLNTLIRTNSDNTCIENSHFNNGASGVACAYKILQGTTGLEAYAKGCEYWTEQTITYLEQELSSIDDFNLEGQLLNEVLRVATSLIFCSSDQSQNESIKILMF